MKKTANGTSNVCSNKDKCRNYFTRTKSSLFLRNNYSTHLIFRWNIKLRSLRKFKENLGVRENS